MSSYYEIYGKPVYSKYSGKKVAPHVWEWENFMETPKPIGCHIHHFDSNPRNNDILNLFCMTSGEHTIYHNKYRIKNGFYGKKHSEESKNKMKGRVLSEETKKKISESRTGLKLSEESKRNRKEKMEKK